MKNEETVKRKNRNVVRKKAAGEKRCFQEAKVPPHQDLHLLLGLVGKQEGMAHTHRMRGMGPLQVVDFGNSDVAKPLRICPLHPHVHKCNQVLLFCHNAAYSRAFRYTSVELLWVQEGQ